MAKWVCVCLCVCVQLVYGQFGFFPPRENRGYSQSFLSPSRIRQRLQGLLHLQPQTPNDNPTFIYPFNRPTHQYGRPYEYGRPNYEYDRPNYDNVRPNNEQPNQNQFGVPNRNEFQEQDGPYQNGFQNPPSQNGFRDPPSQASFPDKPPQFPNMNGFQNPPNQNSFPEPPSQNGFPNSPSQVGFPSKPSENEFPSTNGFQNPSSPNEFQEAPNQNGFQNPPSQVGFPSTPSESKFPNTGGDSFKNPTSQTGFQKPPSLVGFPSTPSENEFPNTNEDSFKNPPSQTEFHKPPSQVGFPSTPSENEFPYTNGDSFKNPPGQNGFQELPSENGFQNAPSQEEEGFPSKPQNEFPKNIFQDPIMPNGDSNSNSPKEAKTEDTLTVIPGKTDIDEDAIVFGNPSNAAFSKDDSEASEVSKATEETPKPESTTVAAEFPPLTPISFDSRNNFNFGPSGIFRETCTTVDNEVGSCLQVTECQPYLKLIQESRSNPNALRLLRQAHCGFQGNNPKVCCPRLGIPTGPPPGVFTTTTTEAAIVMPDPEPSEEPSEPSEEPSEPQLAPITLPEAPVCGVSNASFSRVVGGIPAKLGDFPWMALLGYKERRAGAGARWLCGGSLISARHVLTAAHCIHTRENDLYLVRLGELDLERDDEGATPVDVPIKTVVKHEEYSPKSFTNDIGILVLSRNVPFTNLIQPICIPRSSDLRSRNYENYTPLIAGWGDTEFRGPSATHLQVLQLPVVSNDYCAQAYAAYKAQVIDQRVLCAGFKKGGKDACQGDSGGPLMQPIYNSETRTTYFYQTGVVSYGKKCAEAGFPGVYTRVTVFVPWIEDTVAKN